MAGFAFFCALFTQIITASMQSDANASFYVETNASSLFQPQQCPLNYYCASNESNSTPIPCPTDTFTENEGAVSIDDCKFKRHRYKNETMIDVEIEIQTMDYWLNLTHNPLDPFLFEIKHTLFQVIPSICPLHSYCPADLHNQTPFACPYRTYTYHTGSKSIRDCKFMRHSCWEGEYFTEEAESYDASCAWCEQGYFCRNTYKSECPASHYQPNTGTTSCLPCVQNGFVATADRIHCVSCPANSFCSQGIQNVCPPNSTSKTGSWDIYQCICPFGHEIMASLCCKSCSRFQFRREACTLSRGTLCSSTCGPGTFVNSGNKYCDPCPLGTFNGMDTVAYQCASCPQGKYANVTGLTQCLECPPNTTTTQESGFISCVQACSPEPGFFCPSLVGTPQSCPMGYYCTGSIEATLCPSGTINVLTGSSSINDCTPCPKFFSSSIDRRECSLCPSGSRYIINNADGPIYDTVCPLCNLGSSSALNSSKCTDCYPGFYADQMGLMTCKPCRESTFTYNVTDNGEYIMLWGADSEFDCLPISVPGKELVCLPGTYKKGAASCLPSPRGYYCPKMSNKDGDQGALRKCPSGFYSTAISGAKWIEECTQQPIVDSSIEFQMCGLSLDDTTVFDGKTVTSMTPSLDRKVLYFTTNTAVYRLYLVQSNVANAVELLAGDEAQSGNIAGVSGPLARFSQLSAIGVDLDQGAASIAVVGDGGHVKFMDLFTKRVTIIGSAPKMGIVERAGGIAIRRTSMGKREAFVSDMIKNRIVVFDLQNFESYPLVGDFMNGVKGAVNGYFTDARFWMPRGLAFLQQSTNVTDNLLLVADSNNKMIRAVNVEERMVSTWFQSLDMISPELSSPIGISVSPNPSNVHPLNKPLIYVSDGTNSVKIIQFPTSDFNFKIVTEVFVPQQQINSVVMAFPVGLPLVIATEAIFLEIIVLDLNFQTMTIKSLIETQLSNTNEARGGGTGTGQCHVKCINEDCGPLTESQKCGNSFLELDSMEQCDNSFRLGGGCDEQCHIKSGFTCPVGKTRCEDPCVGYNYTFENQLYCEEDCAIKTPRPGYTISRYCEDIDIDECVMGTHTCYSKTSMCDNIPGSYQCICAASFFGDGHSCNPTSYAVYTVVDVPSFPQSYFNLNVDLELQQSKKQMIVDIKRAYARTLFASLNETQTNQSSFRLSVLDLALSYSFLTVDPNTVSKARFEISTLFETFDLAQTAATQTSSIDVNLAISKIIFGESATSGASMIQGLLTRTSTASTMVAAHRIDGWGINLTQVTYNTSCQVSAAERNNLSNAGGCWEIEMMYTGGPSLPRSDDPSSATLQSSKNVLYLPRIDKNPQTLELLSPNQMFTMSSGAKFPCDTMSSAVDGGGISRQSTACCLRLFQSSYRTNSRFQHFLDSPNYTEGVPLEYCDSTDKFNDTYPDSDVVFLNPEKIEDGTTNDLVLGEIDGMRRSEVVFLETIDYTTRTFKVKLRLDENDLKESGAIIEGSVAIQYNLIFFVGLANFKGLGGASGKSSVMASRTSQIRVNVTKTNALTISSFGANQNAVVSSVDFQLVRIKITDFFNPIKYIYYTRIVLVLPANIGSPSDNNGIVPLNTIRVIKSAHGHATSADVNWKQACSSTTNDFFWNDTALRSLVQFAQRQECVLSDLRVCVLPVFVSQIVEFGIALPETFLTDSDFSASNPPSLQVQFMVNGVDGNALMAVRNVINVAVDLTPYAYTKLCESMKASTNLADIIQGDVYIGIATDSNEWNRYVLRKQNVHVPGGIPSTDGFEYETKSLQGSVITFAALGQSSFFEDSRYLNKFVQIHDIHTVHFLEPIGGKNGPSPKFDLAMSMFQQGLSFQQKIGSSNSAVWLEPSAQLLTICPRKPTPSSKTCLTRTDSTFKNGGLDVMQGIVVDIVPHGNESISAMQNMIGALMFGENAQTEYSMDVGSLFHQQLVLQLKLNGRYNRAYSINPLINWGIEAIQEVFPTATSYTVCSKIIAIGMITVWTDSGAPLGRRLLSYKPHFVSMTTKTNLFSEFSRIHGSFLTHSPIHETWWPVYKTHKHFKTRSQSSFDLTPSRDQFSNSLLINLDISGKDSLSQMCGLYLGVLYEMCGVLKLDIKISGNTALKTCLSYSEQTPDAFVLGVETGFSNIFSLQTTKSNVRGLTMLHHGISGCESIIESTDHNQHIQNSNQANSSTRRLLNSATETLNSTEVHSEKSIWFVSYLLMSSDNRTYGIMLDVKKLSFLTTFLGASVWDTFLGGGVSIKTFDSGGPILPNITDGSNATNNNTGTPPPKDDDDHEDCDDMFVTDKWGTRRHSSGFRLQHNNMHSCIFFLFVIHTLYFFLLNDEI